MLRIRVSNQAFCIFLIEPEMGYSMVSAKKSLWSLEWTDVTMKQYRYLVEIVEYSIAFTYDYDHFKIVFPPTVRKFCIRCLLRIYASLLKYCQFVWELVLIFYLRLNILVNCVWPEILVLLIFK